MPNGNNERRLSGIGVFDVKTGVCRGYQETDNSNTSDIEEQDTNVNSLDGFGQIPARVFSFTGGNLSKVNT